MKNARILGLLLLLTVGCQQKDVQPADPVAGTQWYGRFLYTGEPISRVFTLKFTTVGDFVWYDLSGSYTGKWARTDDIVTITFDANGIQTTFWLSGNNQLTNPKNINHAAWTVRELHKLDDTANQSIATSLPKTQWAGRYALSFDEERAGSFLMRSGTVIGGRGEYAVSGAVIRATKVQWNTSASVEFFGVFINDKTLLGNFQWKSVGENKYQAQPNEEFTKKP
jgi:hypothetical protein